MAITPVSISSLMQEKKLFDEKRSIINNEIAILEMKQENGEITKEDYTQKLNELNELLTAIDGCISDITLEIKQQAQAEISGFWGLDINDNPKQPPVHKNKYLATDRQISMLTEQARFARKHGDEEAAVKYEKQAEHWKTLLQNALEDKNPEETTEESNLIMTPVYKKQVENAKKQIAAIQEKARNASATGNIEEATQYETQIKLYKQQMQEALEYLSEKEREILEQTESDLRPD